MNYIESRNNYGTILYHHRDIVTYYESGTCVTTNDLKTVLQFKYNSRMTMSLQLASVTIAVF